MRLPAARDQHLQIIDEVDDEDVVLVYRVASGAYNRYESEGRHWLTLWVRAEERLNYPDLENPEPWLEVNIESKPTESLRPGQSFVTEAYDPKSERWLTNMYYFSHGGLEKATVRILDSTPKGLRVEISGECEATSSPMNVRATLVRDPERRSDLG